MYESFYEEPNDCGTMMTLFIVATIVFAVFWFVQNIKNAQHNPPDIKELGRSSWTLLHSIAANHDGDGQDKTGDMSTFLQLFAKFYPCKECSDHMKRYLQAHPPDTRNKHTLQNWCCQFHNDVNRKLGKPLWNCNETTTRWGNGDVCTSCKPKW